MPRESKLGIWQGIAVCAAVGLSMTIAEYLDLDHATESVCVFTALLFATLIVLYRDQWGNFHFWRDLMMVVLFHVGAASVVLKSISSTRWLPGIMMTIIVMIEAAVIIVVLDARLKQVDCSGKEKH